MSAINTYTVFIARNIANDKRAAIIEQNYEVIEILDVTPLSNTEILRHTAKHIVSQLEEGETARVVTNQHRVVNSDHKIDFPSILFHYSYKLQKHRSKYTKIVNDFFIETEAKHEAAKESTEKRIRKQREGAKCMARKNAKQSRLDVMTQRQRNKLAKIKLNAKRKDKADWTDRTLKKLKENEKS